MKTIFYKLVVAVQFERSIFVNHFVFSFGCIVRSDGPRVQGVPIPREFIGNCLSDESIGSRSWCLSLWHFFLNQVSIKEWW